METFAAPRQFVRNPNYARDRREALAALDLGVMDAPTADIVAGFATVPHCFTLQCCWGHFIHAPGQDQRSLEPLRHGHSGAVRYRIAYLGFCLENSRRGRALRDSLERVPAIDPAYVQFGSADWFWERRPNSYALQVEPTAHQLEDETVLEPDEAVRTQRTRDLFFDEIRAILAAELRAESTRG